MLLSYVQWKRESSQRAYVVEVRERSGSCRYQGKKWPKVPSLGLNVSSGQGPRLSFRGWMWARGKAWGSLLGVECEPIGISSFLSTWDTPGVAGHVSRSWEVIKFLPLQMPLAFAIAGVMGESKKQSRWKPLNVLNFSESLSEDLAHYCVSSWELDWS